jgi:hypothetical protein
VRSTGSNRAVVTVLALGFAGLGLESAGRAVRASDGFVTHPRAVTGLARNAVHTRALAHQLLVVAGRAVDAVGLANNRLIPANGAVRARGRLFGLLDAGAALTNGTIDARG